MRIKLLNGVIEIVSPSEDQGLLFKINPDAGMRECMRMHNVPERMCDKYMSFSVSCGEDILPRIIHRIDHMQNNNTYTVSESLPRCTPYSDFQDDVCDMNVFVDDLKNIVVELNITVNKTKFKFEVQIDDEDLEVLKWAASKYRLQ